MVSPNILWVRHWYSPSNALCSSNKSVKNILSIIFLLVYTFLFIWFNLQTRWVGDPRNFHNSFFVKNYFLNLNFFQVLQGALLKNENLERNWKIPACIGEFCWSLNFLTSRLCSLKKITLSKVCIQFSAWESKLQCNTSVQYISVIRTYTLLVISKSYIQTKNYLIITITAYF